MQDQIVVNRVVALVSDLMFSSKITATARALGIAVQVVRDPIRLSDHSGAKLLVDLSIPGAIEGAMHWKATYPHPVIGFVSHVDAETISRAKSSGFSQVIPRSAFTANLENILRG